MRSTFYGLEAARSGLFTSQNQLNVTGHNIANVDTLGYTRQRLNTASLPPLNVNVQFAMDNRSIAGRGVETQTIDQIRDLFTDAKYREEASPTGYWDTKMNEFSMVEGLFNSALEKDNTAASIFNALGSFRTALTALEASPSSKDLRTNVLTNANKLAETFNYVYGKLEEQHDNLNSAIEVTVNQINDIAGSIANLNQQIFGYELSGAKANDLRDARNLLLDELSGMVDVQYYENSKGYLTVNLGGRALVDGVESNAITVDPLGVNNKLDELSGSGIVGTQYSVVWADDLGNPTQNPVRLSSGSLKGYLDLRDGATQDSAGIPYAANLLNDLARKIAMEVNEIHREGYTVPFYEADFLGSGNNARIYIPDGKGGTTIKYGLDTGTDAEGNTYYASTTGISFFEVNAESDYSKITAGNFKVSTEIQNNVYLIAASDTPVTINGDINPDGSTNQNTGNALNLKRIIGLYDRKNAQGFSDNYQDALKSLYAEIASQQSHMNNMAKSQQTRIFSIVQQRQSISGVSLDEEMTNVVRFTHAYNANARIITAIDEELDTLINKLGVVGR